MYDMNLFIRTRRKRFFMWLNQVTSTYPPIAHHIKEINYLAQHPELFDLDPSLFHINVSA